MIQETLFSDYGFIEELDNGGSVQVEACFQCRKCTNGCPVTFAMDLFPDEVIRLVILGQRKKVLNCQTIWVCAACETCTTRCPNEIKIAELMDHLKEMAIRENVPSPLPEVSAFHDLFLKHVKKRGRVLESSLLLHYLIRSGQFFRKWKDRTWKTELKLGWKMFLKGKLSFVPRKSKGKKEIRRILKEIE